MTLLVLAAGMGSRYGGLKQIDPFTKDGEFIIDFSVYDALRAGFDRVVFIIKEENYEDFHETIGKRLEGKIKVEYAFQKMDKFVPADKIPAERVKPWGTTHAILCAEDVVGDDCFAVINADDFYGRDAYVKAAEFLKNVGKSDNNEYAMIGYRLGNTLTDNGSVARGVCETKDGLSLIHISEFVFALRIYCRSFLSVSVHPDSPWQLRQRYFPCAVPSWARLVFSAFRTSPHAERCRCSRLTAR